MLRSRTSLAASMICVSVGLASCSSETTQGEAADPSASSAPALGHVHGLGIDPADDTLYVASHSGVYQVTQTGAAERVADRYQDTMGFAVVGPGNFLASGHPDLREDLPTQLGLIESTDAARTWTALSLEGKADFHAIEPAGNRIYAYDSVAGALITSLDRREWTVIERRPLLDLAADPANPDVVYASTPDGEVLRSTAGSSLKAVAGAPRLGPLDWQPSGPLVGVGADGTVMVSEDAGATWAARGRVEGDVEALDVVDGRWHVATSHGVFESNDQGQTWQIVLRSQH